MRKMLSSVCWIVWSAYFMIWPLDTLISNFEPAYSDPQEGFIQKALFNYISAYNYLFLAAIALSAVCLLQSWISRRLARRVRARIGCRSDELTHSPAGVTSGDQADSDSRLSGRRMIFASIAILALLYAISWWFRPFLNAPTILAAFWIGVLAVSFCRRMRHAAQP